MSFQTLSKEQAQAAIGPLKIAYAVPDMVQLRDAAAGLPSDATYLIQQQLVKRLSGRGHQLTLMGQLALGTDACTDDLARLDPMPQSWSDLSLFSILQKVTWRVQQALRIPYLNVFTTLRLFDGALRCLPGHDVVYERNVLYRAGIAMAVRRLNLPYVLYIEADEILEHDFLGKPITGLLRWRARRLVRYNLRAADRVLCVSAELKAHLVQQWGVKSEKILVFGNGVDTDRFRPRPDQREEIRAAWGIQPGPLIIFVGNFYAWHDVETLLRSFADVHREFGTAQLLLVGDGDRRTAMRDLAAELGLGHAVRFTGRIPHDDVPSLVAAADIAVAPAPQTGSDFWLSPLKLYEYMASGVAIIASRVGQIDEFIRHEENGLLVSPGEKEPFTNALRRLLSDDQLRRQISQQARHDAVEYHAWERYVDRLEAVLHHVIKERSR